MQIKSWLYQPIIAEHCKHSSFSHWMQWKSVGFLSRDFFLALSSVCHPQYFSCRPITPPSWCHWLIWMRSYRVRYMAKELIGRHSILARDISQAIVVVVKRLRALRHQCKWGGNPSSSEPTQTIADTQLLCRVRVVERFFWFYFIFLKGGGTQPILAGSGFFTPFA